MSDQERFARLLALSKVRAAQVKENPLPFLDEIAEQNASLRRAIEEAIMTLSGVDDLDLTPTDPNRPRPIVETALARNRRARELLFAVLK